ncbi:hypothetical protein ACFQ3Z_40090 [Streptomyces nogalater]
MPTLFRGRLALPATALAAAAVAVSPAGAGQALAHAPASTAPLGPLGRGTRPRQRRPAAQPPRTREPRRHRRVGADDEGVREARHPGHPPADLGTDAEELSTMDPAEHIAIVRGLLTRYPRLTLDLSRASWRTSTSASRGPPDVRRPPRRLSHPRRPRTPRPPDLRAG